MINSWDCFDTLIARYYHYPVSIFRLIQDITGDENFIERRKYAEKICSQKTLDGIYQHLPDHDPELELQLEKEYSYPILENFNRINDGDIIVSDMYLNEEQILDILRYHGLNKDIRVYSTYGRKADGSIWDSLKDQYGIQYHTGDNAHSDVKQVRKNDLKAIYYGGSYLTNHEKLIERYSPYLSYWIKYIRLNNPYFVPYQTVLLENGSISYYYGTYWIKEQNGEITLLQQIDDTGNKIILRDKFDNIIITIYKEENKITIINEYNNQENTIFAQWVEQPINTKRFDEKILWSEQCSYNTPLLINSSYLIPKDIIFSYRDCYYFKKIYDSIFGTNIPVLESCRNSYYYPYSQEYIDYVLDITRDKVIVDLHGTGYSSGSFFGKQDVKQKIMFVSEHSDSIRKNTGIQNLNICFDRIYKEDIENTKFHHNKRASKAGLKCCSGTMLEKFNIPPKLGPMVGWNGECVRKKSEHNQDICNIFDKVTDCVISRSKVYIPYIDGVDDLTEVLLKKMNEDNYTNTVIHSLWDPVKNIKLK